MTEFKRLFDDRRISISSILRHALVFGRLYRRLLRDQRVPVHLKLFFLFTILYIASPFDLVPEGILAIFGIVDDVGLLVLMLKLFLRWCPQDVLMEHVEVLSR